MGSNHCSLDSPGRSGVFRTCRKCLLSVCDGGAEMLVLPLWARCEHPGASRTVQGTMGPNHCCLDSKFCKLLFRTVQNLGGWQRQRKATSPNEKQARGCAKGDFANDSRAIQKCLQSVRALLNFMGPQTHPLRIGETIGH